jgi:hypothetical protein
VLGAAPGAREPNAAQDELAAEGGCDRQARADSSTAVPGALELPNGQGCAAGRGSARPGAASGGCSRDKSIPAGN